jgi:membrane protein YqaA with SNARE-associated domain
MMNLLLQEATSNPSSSIMSKFHYLGAFGLFLLTIIDSSPVPTFCGPDILLVILASTRRNPWFEYAAVATAGSLIGAYITFRLARKAGHAYLEGKFGKTKVSGFLEVFKNSGTGSLAASAAIPFPFPTSLVFAAAGASDYHTGKYLAVVGISRGVRYCILALIADRYGRGFLRILLHPAQHWGWLLLFAAGICIFAGAGLLFSRRLGAAPAS